MGILRSLRAYSAGKPGRAPHSAERKTSKTRARQRLRGLAVEPLEQRVLLSIGPQLLSIQPNEGTPLVAGATLNVSPRELVLRFDEGQQIDPATLGGIRITRSGFDGTFNDGNEVHVDPLRAGANGMARGFVGLGAQSNEVVLRFAETLPDDFYQVTIVGDPAQSPLRNSAGMPFTTGTINPNLVVPFRVDLGAQVVAVVPQPVTRDVNTGLLSQARDQIDVYFNRNDPLNVASAQNPQFYQLLFTANTATNADDVLFLPTSVTYSQATGKAELKFAGPLDQLSSGPGTYRLRIGDNDIPAHAAALETPIQVTPPGEPFVGPAAPNAPGSSFATANAQLGTLSSTSQIVNAAIDAQSFTLRLPGANNEPGHREIPHETHLNGGADVTGDIPTIYYNFRPILGPNPQGGNFLNNITENQKQRAREIFELYGYYAGVKFVEVPAADPNGSWLGWTIATGDLRALSPTIPTGPGGPTGIAGGGMAIMDEAENWGISEFGGAWFQTAMHEIGHLLGLGHSYDLPPITIQGDDFNQVPSGQSPEPVFPGDHDILHLRHRFRPDSKDIDLYRFQLDAVGRFSAEAIAERLSDTGRNTSSLLDSVLTLYEEFDTLRALTVNSALDGQTFIINDGVNPAVTFEFDRNASVAGTNVPVSFTLADTPASLAIKAAAAVNAANLRVRATADGGLLKLKGLLTLSISGASLVQSKHREMIARNDDYFSEDSYLDLRLGVGVYYIAVTSTGNTEFDPTIEDSGFGGTTQGAYQLRVNFAPDPTATIVDTTGTALDGDGDGRPGGAYNFWFQVRDPANTIFVDKASPSALEDGSLAAPYKGIPAAFAHANATVGDDIVRIVGNFGADGVLATPDAGTAVYEIGLSANNSPLADGSAFNVPKGVTVMVDAGAVFKLSKANIDVGSSAQGVDRSRAHLQVLGTPDANVFFTSYHNERIGKDNDPTTTTPIGGDWGGIVLRNNLDLVELDPGTNRPRIVLEREGIFLNYINQADISYGGGKVTVNSVAEVYTPIHLVKARPSIYFNTITKSADAAISGDPDSFAETKFQRNDGTSASPVDYFGPAQEIDNASNTGPILITTPQPHGLLTNDRVRVSGVLGNAAANGIFTVTVVNANQFQLNGSVGSGAYVASPGDYFQKLSGTLVGSPNFDAQRLGFTADYQRVGPDVHGNRLLRYERGALRQGDIDGASNTGPIVITSAAPHGLITGDRVRIVGVRGNLAANGEFVVTVTSPTQFSLDGSVGNGTYVASSEDKWSLISREIDDVSSSGLITITSAGPHGLTSGARVRVENVQGNLAANGDFVVTVVSPTRFQLNGVVSNGAYVPSPGDRFSLLVPVSNTVNGMFVRIRQQAGQPLDLLTLPARWDDTDIPHVLTENLIIQGTPGGPRRNRLTGLNEATLDARLAIDPGMVVKLEGARIEAQTSAQLLAEGTAQNRIIFTALRDDRYGFAGTFDTNGDGVATFPFRGLWGGLFFGHTSSGSIDQALVTYAGGSTRIEGGFDKFNAIEIHQADVRIANSTIRENADGAAATGRANRGGNTASTIFVRGAQPVIVGNILQDNTSHAININANSLQSRLVPDPGRSRGTLGAFTQFHDNHGPLVRLNRMVRNDVNGLVIRGATLTTESVWDDTDVAHVLYDEIMVLNHHTFGGLRLQSSEKDSLVVKLSGANTGLTANGVPLDINDRIGGTIHVVGTPNHPVVMTSLSDCTVGAGLTPDGAPMNDTDNLGLLCGASTQTVTSVPFADVVVIMDESASMGFAQNFSVSFIASLDQALVAAGVGASQGPNRYGLAGFGGSSFGSPQHERGHAHPVGPGGALFGTAAEYGVAATSLVVNGAREDGYEAINFALQNYTLRPQAEKIYILVTNEDRDVLDASLNFNNTLTNLTTAGITLHTIVAAQFRDGTNTPALGLDAQGTAYLANGTGGFLTSPGGFVASGFGTTKPDYIDLGFATGGISGDINQIQAGGNTAASFSNALVSTIVTQVTGGGGGSTAGDWRSIKLEKFSNDRNVAVAKEVEDAYTGGREKNSSPNTAQFLGNLAPNEKSGDDIRRLGFVVRGYISLDDPTDVDVYTFNADAGTEVWLDIDRTTHSLDTIVELIDAGGNVLARSINSEVERNAFPPNNATFGLAGVGMPALTAGNNIGRVMQRDNYQIPHGYDFFTTNPRDAGMRLVLPGPSGTTNTYFVRVRSNPTLSPTPVSTDADKLAGLTRGAYELQVRLREVDEAPGSTVRFADIRYATNGIEVLGLPAHSPLLSESSESSRDNDFRDEAQELGNLLTSDRNTISVSGRIGAAGDVDFYRFTIDYDLIQAIGGVNAGGKTWSTIFDIDYADGMTRADTTLAVFDQDGNLLLLGSDSNISDDQPDPLAGPNTTDLRRGSFGARDPYIGPVHMPEGTNRTYYVAVSSEQRLPTALNAYLTANPANPLIRLEPVNSTKRVVEDHIGYTDNNATPAGAATTPIFDAINLNAHVRPYSLSDVVLFVNSPGSGGRLWTIDPFTGKLETDVGSLPGTVGGYRDIAMRNDGMLFGYTAPGPGANQGNVGNFRRIDTGDATETPIGDDSIDVVVGGNVPQTHWINYEAMAFAQTQGSTARQLYVVGTTSAGVQNLLYRMDPNSGVVAIGRDSTNIDPSNPRPLGWDPVELGRIRDASGTPIPGTVTGLAVHNGTIYGVTSLGRFYRITTGAIATEIPLTNLDVLPASFSALTVGPPSVEDAAYANTLFAIGSGRLYAFDTAGVGQEVFAFDPDNPFNPARATSVAIAGPTGLAGMAFSTLDYNLWHTTPRRGTDPGHGVNAPFDGSRDAELGGTSFYFGLEPNQGQPGALSYGTNPSVYNTYDLPGGAHGSLVSNSFSLEGYSRQDRPTLYFNYFLHTESDTGSGGGNFMRDAARVFLSPDDGATWFLLATSNTTRDRELPEFVSFSEVASGAFGSAGGSALGAQRIQELFDNSDQTGWRQARVALGDFAGLRNLKLRFDFSTSGVISDRSSPGFYNQSLPGDQYGDFSGTTRSRERGQRNNFEGFYIDDIIVGFAERGEMATASTPLSTYFPVNIDPTPDFTKQLIGEYQLEIRRGTEYAVSRSALDSSIQILRAYDTNDRHVQGFSLTAGDGQHTIDGDRFMIGDGLKRVTFEFDSNNSVNGGLGESATHRRIAFTSTQNAAQIAQSIADAVNLAKNLGLLDVTASPVAPTAALPPGPGQQRPVKFQVDLFGAAFVDNLSLSSPPAPFPAGTPGSLTVEENDRMGLAVETGLTSDTPGTFSQTGMIGDFTPNARYGPAADVDMVRFQMNAGDQINVTLGGVAAPSGYTVQVVFPDSSLTPSQQAIFAQAAQRWSQIIIGDVPDVNMQGLDGWGLVDDVAIRATAPFIDGPGGILGQAGPTYVRTGTFLPITGIMQFDSADLAVLEASGQLLDVILHEMAHVIGIGTIWGARNLVIGAGTVDPRFIGAQATAEYNSIFGQSGTSVPLENTGGQGTADSHWRESVFNNELMTGYLNSGFNPISRVTVASLADLGYQVDMNAADPYTPPSPILASAIRSLDGRILVMQGPFGVVDPLPSPEGVMAFQSSLQANSTLSPWLRLFSGVGVELVSGSASLSFTAPANGIYYVGVSNSLNRTYNPAVTGSGNGQGTTGSYNLTLTLNRAMRPGFHTATPLAPVSVNNPAFYGNSPDQNLHRDQGQILLEGNRISQSKQFAIVVDASTRGAGGSWPHPGAAHHLRQLNPNRLAPGVTVFNNLLFRNDAGGIFFSGDPNPANQPLASVPFGRIINNTIYGAGTPRGVGIQVTENASPTILNNIVASLDTGVEIDASSRAAGTVLGGMVYHLNNTDANTGTVGLGTFPLQLTFADPLFVDAASGNFYLAAGSQAIDASVMSLPDRPAIVNVRTEAGIPQSPILAPVSDLFGQLRLDDPTVSPPFSGLGTNPFIDRGALERVNTLTISDVVVTEGDVGTINAIFTVTLTRTTSDVVTVFYNTADNTAALGADYLPTQGTLTFNPGVTTQFITVQVVGDVIDEDDETFVVNLSGANGAIIADTQGVGTIRDDDAPPSLTINDVTVVEGDAGVTVAVFTVRLSVVSGRIVSVNFTTADNSATSGNDYVSAGGILSFAPGTLTRQVTVQVLGDTLVEANETFFVNLSSATNATIADGQGIGTIRDDDTKFTINDIAQSEPAGFTTLANAVFTVSIPGASPVIVTVEYSTADGTGVAGVDYVATSGTVTFQPGQTSRPVTVQILGDLIDEFDETFFVNLTNPNVGTILDSQGMGTIVDNDLPPAVRIDDVSVQEGDAGTVDAVFNVTLTLPSGKPITVSYATANGTTSPALAGSDYLATSGVLSFAPGVVTLPVTVKVLGDTLLEPNEMFFVDLTGATDATIIDNQGVGTILDDEARVTISDVTVTEDVDTSAVFTLSLNKPSPVDIVISYSTADGTGFGGAVAGQDYTAASGDVTFFAGETQKTVVVPILGDTLDEPEEVFFVNLSGPPLRIADGQGVGRIVDNDPPPTLSIANASRFEGNVGQSDLVFNVSLSTASAFQITVPYTTTNGTALGGTDYLATSGVLTFAAGTVGPQSITVKVVGDTTTELDETFFVDLGTPVNATLAAGRGTGTIVDDDPEISIAGVTFTEGDSGSADALFPVTLSKQTPFDVTVSFVTSNGTAVAPADYAATSGQLTILAGQLTGFITIAVQGDLLDEDDETFTVSLSNPINGNLVVSQAIGTIVDNDNVPEIGVSGVQQLEGNSGLTLFVFNVTLSAPSGRQVRVSYATQNGTATTANLDYNAASGTLLFAPGETSKQITVQVRGDTVGEADENFFVNFTNPVNATLPVTQAVGTILDDEPRLSIDDVSVSEGNSGTASAIFTVTRTAAIAAALNTTTTVTFNTANGTAVAPADYAGVAGGTLVFGPGETSKQITVLVSGDVLDEDDETFFVNLANPVNAFVLRGVGTGTIVDDDPLPSLSIADASADEGNGSPINHVVFNVTLSAQSGRTVTVVFATADNAALAPGDYAALSGTLTFQPGQTVQQISVPVVGDTLVEFDETFFVNLTSPVNATLTRVQAVGTILDDEPKLSVADVTVIEGDTTVFAPFVVRLDRVSTLPVTVAFATRNGTALATQPDYTPTSGTLTFQPGETSTIVQVAVTGDLLDEDDEHFFLDFSGAVNARLLTAEARATIIDNDPPPRLVIDDVSVTEGDSGTANAVFTVRLTNAAGATIPSGRQVTVAYSTLDGTADTNDYNTTQGTLTFLAGQTSQTITVQVKGDLLEEQDETFLVALSNADNATIGRQPGIGTILDDEPRLVISDATATEPDSATTGIVFTVSLTKPSTKLVTAKLSTANGTARAGEDYLAVANMPLTFQPGITSQQITLFVLGDVLDENDETFFVNLHDATNTVIFDDQGVGTIVDNDPLPVLRVVNASLREGVLFTQSEMVFTVQLVNAASNLTPSGRTVTVNYATADNTAVAADRDYVATSGALSFAPGETSKTVTVVIEGDDLEENDETFHLNFTGGTNVTIPPSLRGVGTIVDDDGRVSIADLRIDPEGNSGTRPAVFNVTLSKIASQPVHVVYTTSSETALAGSDFASTIGTLTIAPGQTSALATVLINGDVIDEPDETFLVNLQIPDNSALPGNMTAVGTIVDDDPTPTISIGDVQIREGNSGVTNAAFTVSLSVPSGNLVTVQFVAAGRTATAGVDFTPVNGTLTFNPGQSTRQILVPIIGDLAAELDETFDVTLSNPVNATLARAVGVGTILNDEAQHLIVTGADAGGGPHVRAFDAATGAERHSFFAYAPGFTGGVRVASGDVNGDGQPDMIVAPGRGGGPHIRVFDGKTGQQISGPTGSFFAFEPTMSRGLHVAAGDVNNDGRADIIVATDGNAGEDNSRVRVIDGATGAVLRQFDFPQGSGMNTGLRVAAGDIDGDGRADVIIASGRGVASQVLIFDVTSGTLRGSFSPYGGFTGGVFVGAGDLNGDGRADIITGADQGGGPHVRILSGSGLTDMASFFAYHPSFSGGVRVSMTDYNGDGRADAVMAAGPGGGPHVRVLSGAGLTELASFFAYAPSFPNGVFVGGSFRGAGRPLQVAGGSLVGPSPGGQLSAEAVQPLVERAIADWAAAGLDPRLVERLRSVEVRVADLPGGVVAMAHPSAIYLDIDAAGYGWFVDPTPGADEEFELLADGTQRARAGSAAMGRIDLLTAISHEFGHLLGLEHDEHEADLMAELLTHSTRRGPQAEAVEAVFAEEEW